MCELELTKGFVTLLDREDFHWASKWKWFAKVGSKVYAVRYRPGQRLVYLHKEILKRKLGHSDFLQGDHESRNSLDNRRFNLRPATPSQNKYNQRKYKNSTSGYKGVRRNGKGWQAKIRFLGNSICLGTFDDKVEAAMAYDRAARRYHGEFAQLNIRRFPRRPNGY